MKIIPKKNKESVGQQFVMGGNFTLIIEHNKHALKPRSSLGTVSIAILKFNRNLGPRPRAAAR